MMFLLLCTVAVVVDKVIAIVIAIAAATATTATTAISVLKLFRTQSLIAHMFLTAFHKLTSVS